METFLECKRQRSRPAGGGCGLDSEHPTFSEYKPQPPPAGRERWRLHSKQVSIATTKGRVTVRKAGSCALLQDSVPFCALGQTLGAKPHEVAQRSRCHPWSLPALTCAPFLTASSKVWRSRLSRVGQADAGGAGLDVGFRRVRRGEAERRRREQVGAKRQEIPVPVRSGRGAVGAKPHRNLRGWQRLRAHRGRSPPLVFLIRG